jgi:hypothetical protein
MDEAWISDTLSIDLKKYVMLNLFQDLVSCHSERSEAESRNDKSESLKQLTWTIYSIIKAKQNKNHTLMVFI